MDYEFSALKKLNQELKKFIYYTAYYLSPHKNFRKPKNPTYHFKKLTSPGDLSVLKESTRRGSPDCNKKHFYWIFFIIQFQA